MLYPPFLSTGQVQLTLHRRTSQTYVNGRAVKSASADVIITANVQPVMKMTDLQFLPEGDRSKKTLKVYSKDLIRQKKEGTGGWDADTFTWEGELYEVRKVVNYGMGVLNHYHAICVRLELT